MSSFESRLQRLESAMGADRAECICEDGPKPFGEFVGEGSDCKCTCARCGGFWPDGWTFHCDILSGKAFTIPPGKQLVQPRPPTDSICRCENRSGCHFDGPEFDPKRFWICDDCGGLLLPSAIESIERV